MCWQDVEGICYENELARAEAWENSSVGPEPPEDYHDCEGWDMGECWCCPNEGECFPGLAG